jgi:hypothetical protein
MLSESTTGSAVVSLLPRSLIYGDIYVKEVHKFHESRETPTVSHGSSNSICTHPCST